ncbi:MAG: N-acetyl-alpha-D-glucosaminyl L-malate synthase BshA [Candidatus Bathyarchaeota archaeon]|nr:MAG: N-acetyl-alpha-D-glucosaminyl L-malate synthase BshA [Candidatus Bathyarchaeota archaeon]
MRIGIACFPTYGGSGIIATELAHLLSEKHELHLVSYDTPVRLEDKVNFSFHKVELLSYPLFERVPCCYSLALISKLSEVIKNHNLDIVHAHYAVPNATSAYLAKKICNDSVKVVTTLHGTDSYLVGSHPSYKEVTQFSMQNSDALTTVSEYLKERTITEFNLTKKIRVIPNFVDPQKFKRLNKDGNERIVCHSSNFRPIKRIPDIIKAFKEILQEVECKLFLIGDGPEKPKAQKIARNLGISDNIKFFGNVKNVQQIIGKCDLFLLPSDDESFGLAALEAMSCEVPIIATNVGGLKELISHGVDGYLIEVGNVKMLAQHAIKILKNPVLQREFGRNAKRKVLEKYIPDRILPQYEDLYDATLREN